MKSQTERTSHNSLWDLTGNLCMLIMLPVIGVTIGIYLAFLEAGQDTMPLYSWVGMVGMVASGFVLLMSAVIFPFAGRPIDALLMPVKLLVLGLVAPLMLGLCLNLQDPTNTPEDIDTFIAVVMYLAGIVCWLSFFGTIDAYFSYKPRKK